VSHEFVDGAREFPTLNMSYEDIIERTSNGPRQCLDAITVDYE
jgi:hypothetical protein